MAKPTRRSNNARERRLALRLWQAGGGTSETFEALVHRMGLNPKGEVTSIGRADVRPSAFYKLLPRLVATERFDMKSLVGELTEASTGELDDSIRAIRSIVAELLEVDHPTVPARVLVA